MDDAGETEVSPSHLRVGIINLAESFNGRSINKVYHEDRGAGSWGELREGGSKASSLRPFLFSELASVSDDLHFLQSSWQFFSVGTIIFILQMEKPSPERLSALPQVTQQVRDGYRNQTQGYLSSSQRQASGGRGGEESWEWIWSSSVQDPVLPAHFPLLLFVNWIVPRTSHDDVPEENSLYFLAYIKSHCVH